MTLQRGFDLAEVETMAAYLDLMIAAPDKAVVSIRRAKCEIAGPEGIRCPADG